MLFFVVFLQIAHSAVVLRRNGYIFSSIANNLLLFIATIVCSYFEKPVLCIFLDCFKCEINRCLGILSGLVLSHLSTTDLLKF